MLRARGVHRDHLVARLSGVRAPAAGDRANDSRPSFSGTWKLDPARSESAASSDSAEPLVEITQTDRDLTIETTQGDRHNRVVHGFVASRAAPFSMEGRRDAPTGMASRW